jgi:hypothetical protein
MGVSSYEFRMMNGSKVSPGGTVPPAGCFGRRRTINFKALSPKSGAPPDLTGVTPVPPLHCFFNNTSNSAKPAGEPIS